MIEKLLTTGNQGEWKGYLPITKSVFGSVEYAQVCERYKGFSARLYVCETSKGHVAYPLFLRRVDALPFCDTLNGLSDTLTPEFTGPIAYGDDEQLLSEFPERFSRFCLQNRIVAEFAHLHCWDVNEKLLVPSAVQLNREIVWIDLQVPYETLWQDHFAHACRKNINRAQREGVRVFWGSSDKDVRDFYQIYTHTMHRNSASADYFFPVEYFLLIRDLMPENARFVLAEYNGNVVAATLYLHDYRNVYSYLGGAHSDFQQVRPTNAVIQDTIVWAQGAHKTRLILGGGYRPDDGIFRFKATFSPLRARFSVYRRVHLPDMYADLGRKWSEYYRSESVRQYFPSYRAPAPTEQQSKGVHEV